uniref:Putative secreted protein 94 n=1 Tax=Amblyomma cajennense TaxID=34607 RepID=A0A023FF80_AMBCJ
MLLVAFFIVGCGLCATEGTALSVKPVSASTEKYTNMLKVLRMNCTLRLLMISKEIENKTEECLSSYFLENTTDGARRTLQTDIKFNKTAQPNVIFSQSESEIRIAYKKENSSVVVFVEKGDPIYNAWGKGRRVTYANEDCFILKAGKRNKEDDRMPCVLFGRENSRRCFATFKTNCTSPKEVDLGKCETTDGNAINKEQDTCKR